MPTLTRSQTRRLRGVFRRHPLGITHRGAIPPLVFRTEGSQLRAQHRYASLAIEFVAPGNDQPDEVVALSLDALADFEGRDESPVTLEAATPDRTIARWVDHGVPQSREYNVPALDTLAQFPDPPAEWVTRPAGLLADLAEACRTSAEESTRYALNCIQLRGGAGEIAATDGRQLLLRRGLKFPWTEDLLIRRSLIFTSNELPRDQSIAIGRTDSHVVLRVGRWTLFLEVQAEGRFPVLGDIIPDPHAAATRLRLDPQDVAFLGPALERLPGADDLYSPATLDLNGKVAVRARGSDQLRATELVLSRSGYKGTPLRLNTDRQFLARALRLGLTELEIQDADSPVVARDRERVYCWQPLDKDSALEPTDDVTRIESCPTVPTSSARTDATPKARTTVSQRSETAKTNGATEVHATPGSGNPTNLAALIQEAESLHETLADARLRASRLIVALRRYRRRERLVSTTLASLKALKLQEVAE